VAGNREQAVAGDRRQAVAGDRRQAVAGGPGRPGAALATPAAFVLASTTLGTPPLLPEIQLHLASDVFELWERTEREARPALSAPPGPSPPPFWAFAWAGGQALARYLLDHPGSVRGRAVLDLAAGSGLVAIAALRAGAATATVSETDPLAVAAIELNCVANGVRLAAVAGDVLDGGAPAADVVLVGDAFYERALASRLLPGLERAQSAGARVLVGDPGRAYLPRDRFQPVAAYQVPVSRAVEDAEVKPTTVWRLR
jgi:predicted nicotinamide N-methyase